MSASCDGCGAAVQPRELELDLQGRALCRACRGRAGAANADQQLADHGVRRRCSCADGTLQQQQPTKLGQLRGGGVGGYSRAPIVIGYRYHCERCGRGVWLASGVGVGIYLFIALWFSGFLFFVHENPIGIALTSVVFAVLGGREAWLRQRHPNAA